MMSEPRKRYMEGRFIEGVGGVVQQYLWFVADFSVFLYIGGSE